MNNQNQKNNQEDSEDVFVFTVTLHGDSGYDNDDREELDLEDCYD